MKSSLYRYQNNVRLAMTGSLRGTRDTIASSVVPAKAGIQKAPINTSHTGPFMAFPDWIPVSAGMTQRNHGTI